MAEKTVVHLLRHGEVHNPQGVIYGRLPGYHLSDLGRQMALAAADFFAERPVVAVFSSPLQRAVETATPVAQRRDRADELGRPCSRHRELLHGYVGAIRILYVCAEPLRA